MAGMLRVSEEECCRDWPPPGNALTAGPVPEPRRPGWLVGNTMSFSRLDGMRRTDVKTGHQGGERYNRA